MTDFIDREIHGNGGRKKGRVRERESQNCCGRWDQIAEGGERTFFNVICGKET